MLVDARRVDVNNGIAITVNLKAAKKGGLIGYKAKPYTIPVDIDAEEKYAIEEFWEPILENGHHTLIIDTNSSYILASKELVRIPLGYAAEMIPFNHVHGEFRAHYAGFFDPGFGQPDGASAVFEVRSYGVPFELRDGQVATRLVYERLSEKTDCPYGANSAAHYQGQRLALSKHFIRPHSGH